jgi:hypothetical protein
MGSRIDKREIMAYVFLGDKCIDCLVLGSASATMDQESGGSSSQA